MNPSLELDPHSYVMLLPHCGYHESGLYFGATRIASVSDGEGWFLYRCDGTRTLAEAVTGCNVSMDFIASVAHLLIWWPAPIAGECDSGRPVERLVLTARPEHAWLGMGGRLLLEAGEISTLVYNAFEVFTGAREAAYRTARELSMACADEARTAARLCVVQYRGGGIPEHAARRLKGLSEVEVSGLVQTKIAERVDALEPAEIFVPAALRGDVDARLLLDAVLALLGDGELDADVHLYEDAPAALGDRLVDDCLLRFESSFLEPRTYFFDVGRTMARKTSLLDVFACRMGALEKRSVLPDAIRHTRDSGVEDAKASERFWRLEFAALE